MLANTNKSMQLQNSKEYAILIAVRTSDLSTVMIVCFNKKFMPGTSS
jgi:hypothetical protein